MVQVTAKLNNLRIAPRKVRLVARAVQGLSVNEAEAQLLFRAKRSSKPLLELLRSAAANAKNNYKLNPTNLVVKNIRVDQGPTLKRFLPRAMGRATPLQKKTSHISLILEEAKKATSPRFNIATEKKIKSKNRPEKIAKSKMEIEKPASQKPKESVGFFKRFFRRKSI